MHTHVVPTDDVSPLAPAATAFGNRVKSATTVTQPMEIFALPTVKVRMVPASQRASKTVSVIFPACPSTIQYVKAFSTRKRVSPV